GRHVSKDVAASIWHQRDDLLASGHMKSQEAIVTVMFLDLVNFTGLAEPMSPPEVLEWLNAYLEALSDEVTRHEGMVNKYIGDSIMALFGLPVVRTTEAARDRDARNAVRCAVAMRATLATVNAACERAGRPTVAMRIGIHTGPLVVGSVGSR